MSGNRIRLTLVNKIPIWGGGELWSFQVAKEFKKRGYDVAVIAAKDGKLSGKLTEADIPHQAISLSIFRQLVTYGKLKNWIKKTSPDLLLTNCGQDVRLAILIQLYHNSTKLIFRRGLDNVIKNSLIHQLMFKRVDFILTNSEATRLTMAKSFPWFPEDKIATVYNPINTEEFLNYDAKNIRKRFKIPEDARVIGIIGRLSKQKGHLVLFKAFQKIIQSFSNTYLLIVGEGESRQTLMKQVEDFGIGEYSVFTGHADSIQPFYKACDLIAIPSLFEGFCFTAVEAQLLEKPVIASNISSLPEVVSDEMKNFLFPAGNADILALKIKELLENQELRKHLGKYGKTFVEKNFSAKKIYDSLEEIFLRVIENN